MRKSVRNLEVVMVVSLFVLMGNSGYGSAMSYSAPVFEMQELFEKTRILNIAVTTDGTLLAFTNDGRLLRRSEDAGGSWDPIQEVGPDSGGTAIVDQNSGDVLVLRSGNGLLWRSRDQGKTWNKEEIVVKPNALGHGVPNVVGASTHGSESGITLQYGEHKGRLITPVRVTAP